MAEAEPGPDQSGPAFTGPKTGGPLLAPTDDADLGVGDDAYCEVLGLCGYMDPKLKGLLVPPRTGLEGARLGKYSLMDLLVLWMPSGSLVGNWFPVVAPPPAAPGFTLTDWEVC